MQKIYIQNAHCRTRRPPRAAAALILGVFTLSLLWPAPLRASAWNPTLLVNTEAFQAVHEGDSTADVELRFGDTLSEKIYWDRTNAEFRFSDDIHVDWNITASGTLTIAGATILQSTLRTNGVTYTFPPSDGSASGKVLKTNSAGQLSWSADSGGSVAAGQGITVSSSVVSLSSAFSGTSLEIIGTASGRILHAQDELRSSGSLSIESAGFFGSGIVVTRAANSDFLTLKDSTNTDSISIKTGTGNPNGSVPAQLGSIFFASDTGKIWKNNDGMTQWVELASGSGSLHMAKMTRDAAQSIGNSTHTKIAFDAEEFDVGGIADFTTNDRFDISQAGKYLVSARWNITDYTADKYMAVSVYKNGSLLELSDSQSSHVQVNSAQLTTVLDLAAGDYLEMYAYQNSGGSKNTNTSTRKPQMSVVRLDGVAGSTYYAGQGLALNASNVFSIATSFSGTALEIIGTASGRILHAQDELRSSGSLVVEGNSWIHGTLSGNTIQGFNLTDCDAAGSTLQWDATAKAFLCSASLVEKNSDETVNNSVTLQNDDDLKFAMTANTAYVVDLYLRYQTENGNSGRVNIGFTAPTGARIRLVAKEINGTGATLAYDCHIQATGDDDCFTGLPPGVGAKEGIIVVHGLVQSSTTTGDFQLQWAAEYIYASNTILQKNSTLRYTTLAGAADLAELYYTLDEEIGAGDIVRIDPGLRNGVRRSIGRYDGGVIGVVSTKPAILIGDFSDAGFPVAVALAGRVPVNVSAENGPIAAGDYLGPSSEPGVAMRVTGGTVVGQALEPYDGDGVGLVTAFLKNFALGGGLAEDIAAEVGRQIAAYDFASIIDGIIMRRGNIEIRE